MDISIILTLTVIAKNIIMKEIKAMNNKFFEAVDIVCMDCHFASEETCKDCPVRKTCDAMNEKEV